MRSLLSYSLVLSLALGACSSDSKKKDAGGGADAQRDTGGSDTGGGMEGGGGDMSASEMGGDMTPMDTGMSDSNISCNAVSQDCPTGKVCTVTCSAAAGAAVACATDPMGTGAVGALCATAHCMKGTACLSAMGGAARCHKFCAMDTDCGTGSTCQPFTISCVVEAGMPPTVMTRICTLPAMTDGGADSASGG